MTQETLREKSLDWFFQKSKSEKIDLKHKYYPESPIDFSEQWGFHFTFGQIEDMYKLEVESSKN